jgi:uncharacterized protein (DUF1778 family)
MAGKEPRKKPDTGDSEELSERFTMRISARLRKLIDAAAVADRRDTSDWARLILEAAARKQLDE